MDCLLFTNGFQGNPSLERGPHIFVCSHPWQNPPSNWKELLSCLSSFWGPLYPSPPPQSTTIHRPIQAGKKRNVHLQIFSLKNVDTFRNVPPSAVAQRQECCRRHVGHQPVIAEDSEGQVIETVEDKARRRSRWSRYFVS